MSDRNIKHLLSNSTSELYSDLGKYFKRPFSDAWCNVSMCFMCIFSFSWRISLFAGVFSAVYFLDMRIFGFIWCISRLLVCFLQFISWICAYLVSSGVFLFLLVCFLQCISWICAYLVSPAVFLFLLVCFLQCISWICAYLDTPDVFSAVYFLDMHIFSFSWCISLVRRQALCLAGWHPETLTHAPGQPSLHIIVTIILIIAIITVIIITIIITITIIIIIIIAIVIMYVLLRVVNSER